MEKGELSKITTYQAGAVQASMHRKLQRESDRILKPFGISKMHWMIIGHVLDAGKTGIRISDLSSALGTTIPYITTAINLLESKGFLLRKGNAKDGRSKLITINPQMVSKCHEIETTLRQALRKTVYSNVDPADFHIYVKVMYELHAINNTDSK